MGIANGIAGLRRQRDDANVRYLHSRTEWKRARNAGAWLAYQDAGNVFRAAKKRLADAERRLAGKAGVS